MNALSADVQTKMLCSVCSCILRVIAEVNCASAADSLTVLLLDVLSALHDMARDETEVCSHIAWTCVMQRLMDAKTEVEHRTKHDLSAVTKKLTQMRDDSSRIKQNYSIPDLSSSQHVL